MRLRWWVVLWGMGCTGDDGGPDTPGDDPTSGDTSAPTVPVPEASCALSDNPLRLDCAATLAAPGEATLELSAPAAPPRTFVSPSALQHEITGWGLLPETEYTWALGGETGTVTTGPLPNAFLSATVTTTGKAFGFDAVLYPLACAGQGYFTMIDPEGRIIWYEPNNVYFRGSMTGYEWSPESRTVLSSSGQSFIEQHVSGEVPLQLDGAKEVPYGLHHDSDRWGTYRYLLFERRVGAVNVDGILVHDGKKLVATWYMEDHFVVGGGQNDWGHSNGLNVTDDGVIILSVLNFDAVVAIDGDPASDTFLQVLWHAAGSPDSGLPSPDYVALAGADQGFDGQHNASRVGDDLWVFDNSSQPNSRAIRMRMMHDTGALVLTGAWSFDVTCRNQGGALPVPGGVLATCANARRVWLFEEGSPDPVWTVNATCGGQGGLGITRAIPVQVR